MAQPNTVEIVEVCRVAPAPAPSPSSSPKSFPLTFFELRWLRFPPPQRLFFYQIPTTTTSSSVSFFFDSIFPRLKHSLSLTLHHFSPMAGTLTWPPNSPAVPVVVYAQKNDAVSLTLAKSNADSHHLSALTSRNDHVRELDEINCCEATAWLPLLPKLQVSEEAASVLAIQVTLFPNCGYFSIGLTAHHAVIDGNTIELFRKSWAHTCRSLIGSGNHMINFSTLPMEYKPFYDRRSVLENPAMAKLGAFFLKQWLDRDGPNNRSLLPLEIKVKPDDDLVRGSFQLSRDEIESLRRLILANDVVAQHPHVSTFALTCAYTWVCLVKAEKEVPLVPNDNKIRLSFLVDCRSRLEPPLPTTYFGNCVAPNTNVVVVDKQVLLGKEGFAEAVHAISKAIKDLNKESSVLNGAENWVSSLMSNIDHRNTSPEICQQYSVVGSPRLKVYSIDFGWGRPTKVDIIPLYTGGLMYFSESRDGDGGVEIGLHLKKHHLKVFASVFAQSLDWPSSSKLLSS